MFGLGSKIVLFAQLNVVKVLSLVLIFGPFFIGGMMFFLIKTSARRVPPAKPILIILLCVVTAQIVTTPADRGNPMGVASVVSFVLMALALSNRLTIFTSRFTLWLGDISYSLYLVHFTLGIFALSKLQAVGVDSRISFFVVVCGSLSLASALTFWIERPSLRWLRNRFRSLSWIPSARPKTA